MKPRHRPRHRHRHRPCRHRRRRRRRRPGRRRRHRRRRRRRRRRRQLSSWYVFITVVYSFYASRFQGYSLFENVTVIFFLILGKGVYFKI